MPPVGNDEACIVGDVSMLTLGLRNIATGCAYRCELSIVGEGEYGMSCEVNLL